MCGLVSLCLCVCDGSSVCFQCVDLTKIQRSVSDSQSDAGVGGNGGTEEEEEEERNHTRTHCDSLNTRRRDSQTPTCSTLRSRQMFQFELHTSSQFQPQKQ